MIKEDYVSFEVAKLLKEKGFDESCDYYYDQSSDEPQQLTLDEMYYSYDEFLKAPTLQMACKWLREYKKLVISIALNYSDNSYSYSIDSIIEHRVVGNGLGETYEEAVESAIKYTLGNLI